MADFRIAEHITLEGPYLRQLNEMARLFERNEGLVKAFQRTLGGTAGSLQAISSQARLVNRELRGLAGIKVDENFARISKHLTPFLRDMGAIKGATAAVATEASVIAGHFDKARNHARGLIADVNALKRDLAGVRFPNGGGGGGGRSVPQAVHSSGRAGRESSALAGVVGVGAGVHTLQSIVAQGAASAREDLRAKNAGLSPAENATLRAMAAEIAEKYPSLSRLGVRESGRLLIPNVGSFDAALRMLPLYLQGQVALQTVAGPGDGQKDLEAFSRYVDIIGRSMSEGDTRKLIDGYIRARQLDPEAVRSLDFVNMAKSAAATGKSLDVGFWANVAPALISQQGGARSGTDIASAYQNTAIGRATESALAAQAASGLREGFESRTKKNGKLEVLKKGTLIGSDLYSANPYEWSKKYLIPDMVKRGLLPEGYLKGDYSQELTSAQRAGGNQYLSDRFSNRRGANVFSMMIQDMDQVEKVMQSLKKTRGLVDVLSDQARDPYTVLQGTKSQVAGVASAISEPSMGQLTDNLNRLNAALGRTASIFEASPGAAQGVFSGGASIVGGLATAGAAALTVAAVSTLTLPALTIGSIAALTIGTLTFPWEKLYAHMGWKPGLAVGGKNDNIPNLGAIGGLPGVGGSNSATSEEILRRRAAAIQGLGVTAENTAAAQDLLAKQTGRVKDEAAPAATMLDRLGNALKSLTEAIGNGGIQGISWMSGGGGGGGLIHKASLGGGGGLGGPSGPMPGIPSSVAMTAAERNTLGLIQKYESGGRNVMNFIGDRKHTAQGYFQITNTNWRRIAPLLGITAPNAMSATLEEQTRVAHHLLRHGGVQNWSNFNPRLRGALGRGEQAPEGRPAPAWQMPPRAKERPLVVELHMDGRKMGRAFVQHAAEQARHPGSTGGPDTYGQHHGPSTHLTDAA